MPEQAAASWPESGFDVSSARLDALDYACLDYVLENREDDPAGVDLGCGVGVPSTLFALAGARMLAIDKKDLASRFARLNELLPPIELSFARCDLASLSQDRLPEDLAFAYSQRFLHYLRFSAALELLTLVASRLREGGRCFLSVSGMASELSVGYDAGSNVETRFAHLSDLMARKHSIAAEVCLYRPNEFAELCSRAGLEAVQLWKSEFGNVKGVFRK